MALRSDKNPRNFAIEHPVGKISVHLKTLGTGVDTSVLSAGIVRTARLIMRGEVIIPT